MADTLIASLRAQLVMDTQGAERLLSLVRQVRTEAKDAQDRLGRGSIWPHTSEFWAARKVKDLGEDVTKLAEKFVRVQEVMRQTGAPQEALTANTVRFARAMDSALSNVGRTLDGTKRDLLDMGKAFHQAGVGFKGILPQDGGAARKAIDTLMRDLDRLDRKYATIAKKIVDGAATATGKGLLDGLMGKSGKGFGGFSPQDVAAVRDLTTQMSTLTAKLSEVAAAHGKIAQNAQSVIRAEFNVTAAVNGLSDSVVKLDANLSAAAQRLAALEKASNGASKLGQNLASISSTETMKRETIVLADRARASEKLAASYDKLTSAQMLLSGEAARLNAAMDGPVRKSRLLRDTLEALKGVTGSSASIALLPTQLGEAVTSLARSGTTTVLAAQYTKLAEAQERLNKASVAVNASFTQSRELNVMTGRSLESYVAGVGQGLKAPFQIIGDVSSAAAGAVEGMTTRVRAAMQQWNSGGLEQLNASQLRYNNAMVEAVTISTNYELALKEIASQEAVRLSQLQRLEAAERARARSEQELAAQTLKNEKAKRDEMAKTAQFREQLAQNEILRANNVRNAENELAVARENASRKGVDDAVRIASAETRAKMSAIEEQRRRTEELANHEMEIAKKVASAKHQATIQAAEDAANIAKAKTAAKIASIEDERRREKELADYEISLAHQVAKAKQDATKLGKGKDAVTFGVANTDAYKDAQAREAAAQASLKDAQATKALTQARLEHAKATKMDDEIKRLHAAALGLNADQATKDAIATARAAAERAKHTSATQQDTTAQNANANAARNASQACGGWRDALGQLLPHLQTLNALSTLATGNLGLWLGRLASLGTMSQQASIGMIAAVGATSMMVTTFTRFGSEAIRVAKHMEPVEQLLNMIRPASEKVNESFEEFSRVALKYGMSLEHIARPFSKLKIASEGTAAGGSRFKEMMEDVAAISSKFALTQDAIAGTAKALEQMLSKGTVQAEEFRQQLGDRLPAAARVGLLTFRQLSGDANATMAQFLKAMEKRQLISEIFVPTFLAKFRELYGITLEGTDNITAAQGRLTTAWDLFIRSLDKSIGLTRAYSVVLNTLSGGLTGLGKNADLLTVALSGIGSAGMVAIAMSLARSYSAAAAAAAVSGTALVGMAAAAQTARAGLAGVLVAGSAFLTLPTWVIGATAAIGTLVFAVGQVRTALAAAGAGATLFSVGSAAVAGGMVAIRNSLGAVLPLLARFGTLAAIVTTAFMGAYSSKINESLNEAVKTVQANKERIAKEGMPEVKFVIRKDSLNDFNSLMQDMRAYVKYAAEKANLEWSDTVKGFVPMTEEAMKRAGKKGSEAFKVKPNVDFAKLIDDQISAQKSRLAQVSQQLINWQSVGAGASKAYKEALKQAAAATARGEVGIELPIKPPSVKDLEKAMGEITSIKGNIAALEQFKSTLSGLDAAIGVLPQKFEYLKTTLTPFEQTMLSLRPILAAAGPAAQALGVAISAVSIAAAAGVPVISTWVAGLSVGGGVLAMLARRAGLVGLAITALGISMAMFSDPARAATKDVKALSEELDRVLSDRTKEGLVKIDPAQQAIASVQSKLMELRVASAQVRQELEQGVANIKSKMEQELASRRNIGGMLDETIKSGAAQSEAAMVAEKTAKIRELDAAIAELDTKYRSLTGALNDQRAAEEQARIAMDQQKSLAEQAARSWEELEHKIAASKEQLATIHTEGVAAAQAQRELADEIFSLRAVMDASGKSADEWIAKLKELRGVMAEVRAAEGAAAAPPAASGGGGGGGSRRGGGGGGGGGGGSSADSIIQRAEDIIAGVGLRDANKMAKMQKDLREYEAALRSTGMAEEELKGKVAELTTAFQMQAAGVNMASLAFKPLQAIQKGLESFADSIADLLTSGNLTFKSFGDAFKKMALSISKEIISMVIKMAVIKPLMQSLFSGMSGMFGSGGMGLGSIFSNIIPHAKGGVVDQPTFFGAGGQTHVMGEAGAEAILPLARGPGGRLGVALNGDGGDASPTYNITFNVQSNDPASFSRSETQIAAMLSRTVSRGSRNM